MSWEKLEYGFFFLLFVGVVVNVCFDGVVEDIWFGYDNFFVFEVYVILSMIVNCFNCESFVVDWFECDSY